MRISFIWLLLILFNSCLDDVIEDVNVLTEETIYVSGDIVRVTGRIVSESDVDISSYGFEIDIVSTFTGPRLINLGVRSSPGRFFHEEDDLEADQEYFVRAFVVEDNVTKYGDILSFRTLNASILSFSPKFGEEGDELTIIGSNFTDETRVFVGSAEVQIQSLRLESIIVVEVPPLVDDARPSVRVVIDDNSFTFEDTFEYVTGKWEKVDEFVNLTTFRDVVFFKDESSFLFGLGINDLNNLNPSLWSRDFISGEWSQMIFPGTPVRQAFATNGFVGSGVISFLPYIQSAQFWRYEDGFFSELDVLPFTRESAATADFGSELVVFGGIFQGEDDKLGSLSMFKYSKESGVWEQFDETPKFFNSLDPLTVSNGIMYIIHQETGEIWSYNLEIRTWKLEDTLPFSFGTTDFRNTPFMELIDGELVFGLFTGDRGVWRYDLNTRILKKANPYPESSADNTIGHYSYMDEIYVFRTKFISSSQDPKPMELWKFNSKNF